MRLTHNLNLPQTKNVKMFSQCVSICPLNEQDYFNHEGSQNVWNWTPQNTPYLFIYSPKEREKDLVFSWWENALRQFQHKSTTLKPPLILLNSYKIITIILMHTLTFSTTIRRRTIFTKKMLQYFQNDPQFSTQWTKKWIQWRTGIRDPK
jgi:hypothetical protein